MNKTVPKGIRLNNPGNIRYRPQDKWQGLIGPVDGMCQFETPQYGIRVIARQLIVNQDKHQCGTLSQHIMRYAPPVENNTGAYVDDVCARTKMWKDEQIDMHRWEFIRPVVEAIIWHENGQCPYSADVIDKGVELAGVQRPRPTAARDPKVIGATLIGSATLASQMIGTVADAWDNLNRFGIDPRYLMWALGFVAVVGGLYLLRERYRGG